MSRFLRFWGLKNARLDFALSGLTLFILAFSRFVFPASGLWEWDETLFARGMLHFELAAHFPHPPGFPGWLAIGRILLPLAGSPLRALQLASAGFSVLAFWPLAMLGRRVAPPAIASSAALFVLFLPGPWLFAERGFSSTGSACCIFFAAFLLCRIAETRNRWRAPTPWYRDEATFFTLLLTAAFLIRPILLPPIALLWLAGAWITRPRRRLIPGALAGLTGITISILVMVHLEGGWSPFVTAFATHAHHHAERLSLNGGGFADLGLIKGFGGTAVSILIGALSLLGLWKWAQNRGIRSAALWILILSVTIGQLFFLQNRSYARYAVPVQMGIAPLIAGACSLLPASPATIFLACGALIAAAWSLPIVEEQHDTQLAAWRATVAAGDLARERDSALIVGPEIYPFASYQQHLRLSRKQETAPLILSPRATAPWLGVEQPWVLATIHPDLYLPSCTGEEVSFSGVSSRLYPLTQQRFLEAAVLVNPPLPLGQWWARNQTPEGESFMWAGPEAALLIPPLPGGSWIGLRVRPAAGARPLGLSLDGGAEISVPGIQDQPHIFWFLKDPGQARSTSTLKFHRDRGYAPGKDDNRPLSAQVFELILQAPGTSLHGSVASVETREKLRLQIKKHYAEENFGQHGAGLWLMPEASLELEVREPGTLRLHILSPRPTPPRTRVSLNGGPWSPVEISDGTPTEIHMKLQPQDLRSSVQEIRISSRAYRPSSRGSADSRELGIVLLDMDFTPDQR